MLRHAVQTTHALSNSAIVTAATTALAHGSAALVHIRASLCPVTYFSQHHRATSTTVVLLGVSDTAQNPLAVTAFTATDTCSTYLVINEQKAAANANSHSSAGTVKNT